jgi:hypothetical protein
MHNWLQDIALLMEGTIRFPSDSPTVRRGSQAREDRQSYKNNKIGVTQPNEHEMSKANGVAFGNPFEQEEEVVESLVSKKGILSKIESLLNDLNSKNQLDLSAIASLAELKQFVKKN